MLANSEGRCRFALAFLDIDNFKHINDYYTHAIGDALLLKVAQRISAHIRPNDFAGRISGDEFLLVLHPLDSDEELESLIDNLLKELKEPFLIEGYEILTSASIGVSVHPDHGLNYETLRRAADTAMYRAKEVTKGAAALFDTDMGRAMAVRMAQEQRLRLAVRDGRFCCAFQPKVDIRTAGSCRRRSADPAARRGRRHSAARAIHRSRDRAWLDRRSSPIWRSPRSSGRSTCSTTRSARMALSASILRPSSAGDAKFMTGFCEELQATGYANRFMVEVTEDAFFAGSQFQRQFLPMLREIGTRVSVDDFGTGYSSLATLADVTADEIKIDRSFITDIHQRPRSQSVLKAIEALSDALGMTVIAEGVETFEEVAYLQAATRIRFAQGYYFAKPIFLEELAPARRIVGEARSGASARYRTPARR